MSAHAYRASLVREVEKLLDVEDGFLPHDDHMSNPFAAGRWSALIDILSLIKEPDL